MRSPISWIERFVNMLVLAYQVLVLISFVLVPIAAFMYYQTPFPGAFFEHTLVVNGVQAPQNEWELYKHGVTFGDRLTGIDGQPVQIAQDVRDALTGHVAGETLTFTLVSRDGQVKNIPVLLKHFALPDFVEFFVVPFLVGLIYMGVSLWIYGLRRGETSGRAFSMLGASVAATSGFLFDLYTTHYLTYLWSISVPLIGASLIHLGLVFPQEARIVSRYPFLRWLAYVIAVGLAIFSLPSLYSVDDPYAYLVRWQASYIFTGLGAIFFLGVMCYRLLPSSSPVVRQQAGSILIGAFSFLPATVFLLASPLGVIFNTIFYLGPLAIFPIITGYTVLRYRLVRTDYVLGRSVLYTILTTIASLGYIALITGLAAIFGGTVSSLNPLAVLLTALMVGILLNPLRQRLQQLVDSIFFKGERAHQDRLKNYTRLLTAAVSTEEIVRIMREHITLSVLPSQLHVYLYDVINDQYAAYPDETGQSTSDIRFSLSSPLVTGLRNEKLPLFLEQSHLPMAIEAERGRLALLGAELFVPLPGRDRLIGWVAMGERRSGEPYASHDVAFLEALGSQSAVALERAQVVSNMERRVREMNVLARISQGINITINFDDILELIYAQTAQIISGSDFQLMLYNKTAQSFSYAFYLENDERVVQRENVSLIPKSALSQEIIITRRSILTQDFTSQCQVLGVTPHSKGLYAWMGVPLNTGAETIGALSISSRDQRVIYTNAQLDLLQAIADQAAGAIVKSRLLQEMERRTQQLSILNVITRQLTSTLDLQPLLKNILENASNILNTEAGSLFLVDSQTDELIFQVTVGPTAANLAGQRLPPGTGVVGKAVITRQPVISNDVQSSTTWNSNTDRQTGYMTRSILAVPMEVKDRVIGVIEIMNKRDGLPFNTDDQNLLAAFAGQAAVALENARLYTLTDQELNARVEELSVMQRIDRELNASLEVDRAMRITLEWAMRQSKGEAAFIGFVETQGVGIIAHQGYEKEIEEYMERYIPLDHPAIADAIHTGQPRRIVMENASEMGFFLQKAQSQLVIPIRREAQVIGLLLLESKVADRFQQDDLNFLTRLVDHAAIAITNAQLFSEVRLANVKKSEFVSFVAHELKNPMTSIKGYTELMASGAVGGINDNQAMFLKTIRSNVERMKTIVEDLNDNAKIEAGRMALDFKSIDVVDIVEMAVRSLTRQIEDKKQTIDTSIPDNLPKVWADRTRTEQVIVNLVSNAHKYTQEGGNIIVGAEQSANQWDEKGSPQVIHFWVQDNGYGISPEAQQKIFQQYFRVDDDMHRKSPGTGLGLNITRSLVEMQGGRIWFESEFRKGTTFHFTVPISEN